MMEWPRPNEKLIKSDVDWQHNACVDCTTPTLGTYAMKFKAAADRLVQAVASGDAMLDEMIIPIVFLYRHYIELSLKQIIEVGQELNGTRKTEPTKLDKCHNLKTLWREALALLTVHYGTDLPPEAANATSCIEDIDAYDPGSVSFRYPRDWDGKPYLSGTRHINIRNLYETMDRLAAFLDCMTIDLGRRCE